MMVITYLFDIVLCILIHVLATSAVNGLTRECSGSDFQMRRSSQITQRKWGVLEQIENTRHQGSTFRLFLQDDGVFPNNSQHPLLLFQSAFQRSELEGASILKTAGWTSPWVWGIFPYHHYHSNAWEILVCVRGNANIKLGGPTGPIVPVNCGDVVLIPPGIAHKQLPIF